MPQELMPLTALPKYAAKYCQLQIVNLKIEPRIKYKYPTLEDGTIRLLRVFRYAWTNRLICDLTAHDIVARDPKEYTSSHNEYYNNFRKSNLHAVATCETRYNAILYCCGDLAPKYEIPTTNGYGVPLTESAAQIIQYLVPRYLGRYIWLDQLCINQANALEKSNQVAMMDQIFATSDEVLAWLGRDVDGRLRQGIEYIKHIARHGVPEKLDLIMWTGSISLLDN